MVGCQRGRKAAISGLAACAVEWRGLLQSWLGAKRNRQATIGGLARGVLFRLEPPSANEFPAPRTFTHGTALETPGAITVKSSLRLLAALTLAVGATAATMPARAQEDSAGVRMVPPEGEGGRYWPRWRGPSGQGVVEGSGYPDRWSDTVNVLWKRPVPGRGHSSPIVWGDRIFLTTSREGGRRVSILSFRRSDGALLWQADAPNGPAERHHGKNSPASATATTDGERVYASFGSRGMLAVDFDDGDVVWHRGLGRIDNYHGPPARRCSTATASSSTRTRTAARSSSPSTRAPARRAGGRPERRGSAGARRSPSTPETATS